MNLWASLNALVITFLFHTDLMKRSFKDSLQLRMATLHLCYLQLRRQSAGEKITKYFHL